jgi:uncharacterized Ntn-hydrolase superfamily protein
MLEVNTFSISARCARTGMLGVAVSTAVPGVGGICPFVKPGVGALSTQSWVNPYLGIDGLKLLEQGSTAQQALDTLIDADPGKDVRQLGIVDAAGRSAAWSGRRCTDWFGHITGPDFSVQGNMLVASVQFRRWRKPSRAPRASRFRSALWPCWSLASRLAATSAAGSRRPCSCTGRRNIPTSVFEWTSTRIQLRNCAESSKSRAINCCRLSMGCRLAKI